MSCNPLESLRAIDESNLEGMRHKYKQAPHPASCHRSASFGSKWATSCGSGWKNQNPICDIVRTDNASVGETRQKLFTLTRSSRSEYVTRVSVTSQPLLMLPCINRNNDEQPNAGMKRLAPLRYFLSSSLPQDRRDGVEKYIVFPPGVDFSTLFGKRGVGVGVGRGSRKR